MAEGKKSFVMYCEWQELFNDLTDEQCGKLMKHIFAYVNDENPDPPDDITRIAFIQIKQQFKRDLVKYKTRCETNRENGSKGGRPKTQKTQSVILETETNPKNPIKDKGERISDKGELIMVKGKEINDRKADFKKEILPHINSEFTRIDANDFWNYWTEKNSTGRKMKFEMQKTWDTKKRIARWIKNKNEFAKQKPTETRRNLDEVDAEIRAGIGIEQPHNFLNS